MRTVLRSVLVFFLVLSFTAGHARIGDEEIMQMESSIVIERIDNSDVEISVPSMVFAFSEVDIKIKFKNPQHTKLLTNNDSITFIVNGEERTLGFVNGEGSFKHKFDQDNTISILAEDLNFETTVSAYPMWIFFVPVGFVGVWFATSRMGRKKTTV